MGNNFRVSKGTIVFGRFIGVKPRFNLLTFLGLSSRSFPNVDATSTVGGN